MITGSCLCKSVQYKSVADAGEIVHCHCVTCRKAHGSAFSSVAAVADSDFSVVGQEHLKSYESSPGKYRHFCSNCGSHIFAKRNGTKHVILRLGTVDAGADSIERKHIWLSQKANWYSIHSTLEECQEFE